MDLASLLNLYPGPYVVYGGKDEDIKLISSKGTINVWFTTTDDVLSVPRKFKYNKMMETIMDAIYIIFTTGAFAGLKAEDATKTIINSPNNTRKAVILQGYSEFVETGLSLTKESYIGGCVVSVLTEYYNQVKDVMKALSINQHIPLPLTNIGLLPHTAFIYNEITPYIHLYTRISALDGKIPLTDDTPTDTLDLKDKSKQMDYISGVKSSALWIGQLKLLLSEIELMIEVLTRSNEGKFIIVYAGSAPGSHIPYLYELFEDYIEEVHLWDRPSRFQFMPKTPSDIKELEKIPQYTHIKNGKIRIVPKEFSDPEMVGETEGFFTDYVVKRYLEEYGKDNRILFISDIRDKASTESVMQDMKMQREWVEKLNPYASLLKFKLPYGDEWGTDDYEYLDGKIYTQAYARPVSTETRLMSFRPYKKRKYSPLTYEKVMTYFNHVTRLNSYNLGALVGDKYKKERFFHVPIASTIEGEFIVKDSGLCTCHDCARHVQISSRYLEFIGQGDDLELLKHMIAENIKYSRDFLHQESSPKTLWSRTNPKMPARDRAHLVLTKKEDKEREKILQDLWKQYIASNNVPEVYKVDIVLRDKDVTDLSITSIANIIVNADDLPNEQIIQLLGQKALQKKNAPYIYGTDTGSEMNVFRDLLKGNKYTYILNFHTDFTKEYDIKKDEEGKYGVKMYRSFLHDYYLALKSNTYKPTKENHMLLWALTK